MFPTKFLAFLSVGAPLLASLFLGGCANKTKAAPAYQSKQQAQAVLDDPKTSPIVKADAKKFLSK